MLTTCITPPMRLQLYNVENAPLSYFIGTSLFNCSILYIYYKKARVCYFLIFSSNNCFNRPTHKYYRIPNILSRYSLINLATFFL